MNGAIGGEWGLVPPPIKVIKVTPLMVKHSCYIVWEAQGGHYYDILKNRLGETIGLMESMVSMYPTAILNEVGGLVALNVEAIKMFEKRYPDARIIYA